MKVYDCFMFFDENLVLELRLNLLDKYVDYFVILIQYEHRVRFEISYARIRQRLFFLVKSRGTLSRLRIFLFIIII